MTPLSPDSPAWIGPRPGARAMAAILIAGVAGILFAGVGPLLLGGLEAVGRIDAAQLGQAGTAELLTMGLAAGLTGPLHGVRRLRRLVVASGLAMMALNLLSTNVRGWEVVAVRGLAGVPGGALIWLMTAMIVRSPAPERWAAIYLTVQTLAQGTIVVALGALASGPAGTDTGFFVLAAIGALTAGAGLAVPDRLATLPTDPERPTGRPGARGLIALAAVFAFNAGILAVWIYVEPLSRQAGHPAGTAGVALALSLAAQVVGGLVATLVGPRLPVAPVLIVVLPALAAGMALLATMPVAVVFVAGSAMIGFCWMFVAPFFTPFAIRADPTRRAAAFGSGAALLGCGAGPLLASMMVSDGDVRPCLTLGIALLAVSLLIVVALSLSPRTARVP